MINAKVKRKHRNSYKLIYTALFICTLLAYLLTNDLFYSYVCYWNDRFMLILNGIRTKDIKQES